MEGVLGGLRGTSRHLLATFLHLPSSAEELLELLNADDMAVGIDNATRLADCLRDVGRAVLVTGRMCLRPTALHVGAPGLRDEQLTADAVDSRLTLLAELDVVRLPITAPLMSAAWALRGNIAVRDALYVAAAQGLSGRLLTTDDRLARAVGDLAIDL